MRNDDALFQLGMDLDALTTLEPRSTTQTEDKKTPGFNALGEKTLKSDTINKASLSASSLQIAMDDERLDHFIRQDGEIFAGSHIIIDLYEAEGLNDQARIEAAMLKCVEEAGATLLHIHLHPFEPTGVSGVAVLAESHISVHTWPETGYAAFDVFMCGDAQPAKCIGILAREFRAGRVGVKELRRGTEVLEFIGTPSIDGLSTGR